MSFDLWRMLRGDTAEHVVSCRGEVSLSANDLLAEVARLQSRLAGATDPVFLYCDDATNFLAGFLAILASGREVSIPAHEAPGYLQELGAAGDRLVTDSPHLDACLKVNVVPTTERAPHVSLPSAEARLRFYTSGSGGDHKPCEKHVAHLAAEIEAQCTLWGAPEGLVVGTVSHQHIYGFLFRVLWPLASGVAFDSARQAVWEAVAHHMEPGSALISSPAHLSRIPEGFVLAEPGSLIFSSGAPLSFEASSDALAKLGSRPLEILGSTETGGVAWRAQATMLEPWTTLPGVRIMADEADVLLVSSPYVTEPGYVSLGNVVELHDERHFSLGARSDRIVKVEGKRVSLTRVEEVLGRLEEVEDVAVIDVSARRHALGAVVVLSPKGQARLDALGRFRFSISLKQALSQQLDSLELPRLWRFVPEVPVNAQGKRLANDLRDLFVISPIELPEVLSREMSEKSVRLKLHLDHDLKWFQGHFPGQPILPGVAQLHLAASFAHQIWGLHVTGAEMSRIKFRRVLQPGDDVILTLVIKSPQRLDFQYAEGGEICSSGSFGMVVQ